MNCIVEELTGELRIIRELADELRAEIQTQKDFRKHVMDKLEKLSPPRKIREDIITLKEAAELLGRKPQTLHNWRLCGTGPKSINLKGRIFYKKSVLDSFIDEQIKKG